VLPATLTPPPFPCSASIPAGGQAPLAEGRRQSPQACHPGSHPLRDPGTRRCPPGTAHPGGAPSARPTAPGSTAPSPRSLITRSRSAAQRLRPGR
jgi:hypothetical protein